MTYLLLRHLHIACALISIAGFFARGLLMLRDSSLLRQRWLRVLPHLNDSLLLAAALGLAWRTGQWPFADAWLSAKLAGLALYIVLGALALRPGRPRRVRALCFVGALLTVLWIVSVALTRQPLGALALLHAPS